MSYEYVSGMGTSDTPTLLPITSRVVPETESQQQRVVRTSPEQPNEIERAGIQMKQLVSFLRPQQLASGAIVFAVPILAIPTIFGAFGGGDGHRLGGAAYGLLTGTAAGIVGYPLLMNPANGIIPPLRNREIILFVLMAGTMAVPAYFAGKRAKGEER